jgi:hypothetical protein
MDLRHRSPLRALFLPLLAAAIISLNAIDLHADDNSPGELLKPFDPNTTTAHTAPKITYKLSDGSDKWDADPRARIVKAMDEAVAVYNKYGQFDRVLTANWNPGTPTADANFGGWINFGGQIGTRTALHEIAHTLGIGTSPNWAKFARDGKWTGKYGIAQLKQLDGPDAVLHCDHQHFWPYGLNYDNEGGTENFKRNVLMVTAMRADMGLGPPPHPAAEALKKAQADATDAHNAVSKAHVDLNNLRDSHTAALGSAPDVAQASKSVADAQAAYNAATAAALNRVHGSSEYQSQKTVSNQTQQKLDSLRADPNADSTALAAAAGQLLESKTAMSHLESKALASDTAVADARALFAASRTALELLRATDMKTDPAIVAAQAALDAAVSKATAADQALITAQNAASAEKAADATPNPPDPR